MGVVYEVNSHYVGLAREMHGIYVSSNIIYIYYGVHGSV